MQLAENAVRHGVPGSRSPGAPGSPLWLGSAVEAGEAHLWVRDHGPGVADADRRRIFQRSARGGAVAAQPSSGAGLGLAIVQAIAEAHHGRVELATGDGRGARFTVVLPVAAEVEAGL